MSTPHSSTQDHQTDTVLYREKLYPSLGVWLVVLFIAAASLLALLPVNLTVGIVGACVIGVAVGLAFWISSPTITVTSDTFSAGKATIEHRYLGDVEAFDLDGAVAERGVNLHGLAYLCIRGWVRPVVKVQVIDEMDTTPYWLVSSRHPLELLKALVQARETPVQGS